MSLAKELEKLTNPEPSQDPEDDIYEETKAKLVEKDGFSVEDVETNIGKGRMPSLDGMGSRYKGESISRDELDTDDELESNDESMDGNLEKIYEKTGIASDEDVDLMSEEEVDQDFDDEEIDSDEAMGNEDLEIFKQTSEDSHSKGEATRNQIFLWENMLEFRIKCQKLLTMANRIPHHEVIEIFQSTLDGLVKETSEGLSELLYKLLKLQNTLMKQSDALKSGNENPLKRKSCSSVEELDEAIESRFNEMRAQRNKVLKLWYDKTRLTSMQSGNAKSFSNFENRSTVSQIDDILQDKERLIKRCELKRSKYRILGTEESTKENGEIEATEHSNHLKEFNEEIFDDDDFYHQLLRQLIEHKATSGGNSDPLELTRQWLKLQRLRTKVNKNVDTKASKGRKIRYEIHQKLVSFMAPNDSSTFTHEARNQLFRSLFGKCLEEQPEK